MLSKIREVNAGQGDATCAAYTGVESSDRIKITKRHDSRAFESYVVGFQVSMYKTKRMQIYKYSLEKIEPRNNSPLLTSHSLKELVADFLCMSSRKRCKRFGIEKIQECQATQFEDETSMSIMLPTIQHLRKQPEIRGIRRSE